MGMFLLSLLGCGRELLRQDSTIILVEAGGRVTYSDECEDGAPSLSPDWQVVASESHPGVKEETPASVWLIELNE